MRKYLKTIILIICDILALHLSYILAFLLRFGFDVMSVQFDSWFTGYAAHLFAITALFLVAFFACRMYKKSENGVLWRFLLKVLLATLLCQLLVYLFYRLASDSIPQNIYFVSGVLILAWGAASRVFFKLWRFESVGDPKRKPKEKERSGIAEPGSLSRLGPYYSIMEIRGFGRRLSDTLSGKVVLIAGAGSEVGRALVREILYFSPRRLILCDSGEGIKAVEETISKLSSRVSRPDVVESILTLSDSDMVRSILSLYTPHYVFDAEEPGAEGAEDGSRLGEKGTRLEEIAKDYAVQKWVGLRERGEEPDLTAELMLLRLPGVIESPKQEDAPGDNEGEAEAEPEGALTE